MQASILIKFNYGKPAFYPNNEYADNLIKLTGKKTFSTRDLEVIKKLGFTIAFEYQGQDMEIVNV